MRLSKSMLMSVEETAAAEAAARLECPGSEPLMERAGRAAADVCDELCRLEGRSALVLCGPGNNGGDGFVVARLLLEKGWTVRLHAAGDLTRRPTDAAEAARRWNGPVASLADVDWSRPNHLIVDALFGAGLSRDLDQDIRDIVARVNASGSIVVAVDIPTGIDGNTGQERGAAVRASTTVTFGSAKPGHYLYPGAARRGRLVVADIGLPVDAPSRAGARLWLNQPGAWSERFPWPDADGHKYGRGHAVVVSGGISHTGAARLSARAALRIGAGLVTLATPADALAVNAGQLTAVMVRVADGADGLADLLGDARKNSVLLGPGLGVGPPTRDLVRAALGYPSETAEHRPRRGFVLDADALTSFEGDARGLAALIAATRGSGVVTPHDGEFQRLFSNEAAVTSPASKVQRARAAARLLGCVVLLKGADTVVADPDGSASIAAEPVPWLATAGSGDVLAGLIAGLLAQSMPAFEAAQAASYLHAEAGRDFGPGLIAEDLPDAMPPILRRLFGSRPASA